MHSYFRNEEATEERPVDGWLDTGDMGYLADGYLFIVGRAKDMIIINGKNHWPQDIEWAVEQLPGFNHGDIAAFSIETENGEEAPAVLVHCRVSDPYPRPKPRAPLSDHVRPLTRTSRRAQLPPPPHRHRRPVSGLVERSGRSLRLRSGASSRVGTSNSKNEWTGAWNRGVPRASSAMVRSAVRDRSPRLS